ncbi:MAG TPA: hypothetical protein VLE54_07100 [Thermoanaerobaculia bacterium]|nr:hypothetical protein [Thermoanaerobaculia bacterium]
MKAFPLGTRRQAVLFGVLALLLLFFVVRWSARDRPPESPTAPVAANEAEAPRPARGIASRRRPTPGPDEIPLITSRDLNPRLRARAADTGRDLFDLREPTPTPPPPPTAAPTIPPVMGPLGPPTPTPTPTPPDPPFKLIGIFGPKERPIAVLANGDDIFNAREGETVLGRWILLKVGYESIDVGFVGFPRTETRRLPITP